jgi:uncharacterized cupredoxin-like copper-binding protein
MDDGQSENTPTYARRPIWQWLLLIGIIAIVLLGGGYYLSTNNNYSSLSNNNQSPQSKTDAPTPSPIVTEATQNNNSVKQITVEGTDFAFTPSTITVNKDQALEITFKNMGKFPHNLDILDLGVKTKTIQPGSQDTISFAPQKAGSFQFLCTVPGHADKGMVGTITVK